MDPLKDIQRSIRANTNPIRAKNSLWFFKTGKGEYGEGDKFLGLTVPISRRIAKQFKDLSLPVLDKLIRSKYHEERLVALLILVEKFAKADKQEKTAIFNFYLAHTIWINNWDLVDLSAPRIIGFYLGDGGDRKLLYKLARSKSLWERRIAIVTTIAFIVSKKDFADTLKLADILMTDDQDLIQKATGWMLREVGKRDIAVLTKYLKTRYKNMPRTMLRYAIEKFPEEIRKAYLKGNI